MEISRRVRDALSGETLRRVRNALGFTQAYLAHQLDVTEREVRRWEKGERTIGRSAQRRLLEMLRAPSAQLLLRRAGVLAGAVAGAPGGPNVGSVGTVA